MNRRVFLKTGPAWAASGWLAGVLLPGVLSARGGVGPAARTAAREPWGTLEQLADGVWALVSTPLADGPDARRTLANGGIVAGRDDVLLIEGFATDAGARWMAERARELTGHAPSHVVLTHYHGDHSAGLAAYRRSAGDPVYVTTEATRALLADQARQNDRWEPVVEALDGAQLVEPDTALTVDLGGRPVTVTPRAGHTASDLTVTVEDRPIVFCGDLLWNGLFPNYRDATPSVLGREVRAMLADREARYVPGHGSLPARADLANYVALLDHVEAAARRAHEAGTPAEEAAREFRLPAGVGEWTLFSDAYYRVALAAWERELSAGP